MSKLFIIIIIVNIIVSYWGDETLREELEPWEKSHPAYAIRNIC